MNHANLSEEKLMARLRQQFAYSVGIALILLVLGLGVAIDPATASTNNSAIQSIIMFGLFELWTWGAFIRAWRELKRRIDAKAKE